MSHLITTFFKRWGILMLLILAVVPVYAQEPTPDGPAPEIAPEVSAAISRGEQVRVIVDLRGDVSRDFSTPGHTARVATLQQDFRDGVSNDFTYGFAFQTVPSVVGVVDAAGLAALQANPLVERVILDEPVEAYLASAIPLINADDVWNTPGLGYTGNGVRVAVIDTGFDTDHVDIADALIDQKCFLVSNSITDPTNGFCLPGNVPESDLAEDVQGHGTHVSGIITSDNGTDTGVAPDADIIAIKTLGDSGGGWTSDTVLGLEWLYLNHNTLQTDIVNMSLGGGAYSGNCDAAWTTYATVVANLNSLGVTVFAASGNDALATQMGRPACLTGVIAVGNTYKTSYGGITWGGGLCTDSPAPVDSVVCSSNLSSMLDILAPGAVIDAPNVGGGTTGKGGTSMSSPVSAGVAALMVEANGDLTPTEIEDILKATGVGILDARDGNTYPRVDALAAVQEAIIVGDGNFTAGSSSAGEEDGTLMIPLTLNMSDGSNHIGTVTFDVSYGGAGVTDLDNPPTTVSFTDAGGLTTGSHNGTLTLNLIGNTADEGDRDVTITLSNPDYGVSVGTTGSHTLTIVDNDSLAFGTIVFDTASSSANEATGTVSISATLTVIGGPPDLPSPITADVDYGGQSSQFISPPSQLVFTNGTDFASGTYNSMLELEILNNAFDDDDRDVTITLSNASSGVGIGIPGTHTLTIVDDEDPATGTVTFDAASGNANEDDGTIFLDLTLSVVGGPPDLEAPVTLDVGYSDESDLNSAPTQITFSSGGSEFSAGTYNTQLELQLVDNALEDGDRGVTITLSNPPPDVTLGTNDTFTLTIFDDDVQATGTVQFDAASSDANEADAGATIVVDLDVFGGPPNIPSPFTVDVSYGGAASSELINPPTTITFDQIDGYSTGNFSENLDLLFTDDTEDNGNRSLTITLSNPSSGFVNLAPGGNIVHTLNIIDDDEPATGEAVFDAASSSAAEDSGTTSLGLTLTVIDGPPNIPSPFTLDVGYSDASDLDTPPATVEFTNVGGFGAGTYTASIDLTLLDNDLDDGDRAVTITLSNPPTGVTLGTPFEHVLTITDEDVPATADVVFDAASSSAAEDSVTTSLGLTLTVIDGPPNLSSPITLDVGYSDASDLDTPPATVEFTNVGGFGAGTYTATLDLTLLDNALTDGDRAVTITLSNPPTGVTLGTPFAHVLTITDDDIAATGEVVFDASSSSAAEDSGTTSLDLTLTVQNGPPDLSSPITLDVSYMGTGASDLDNPPATVEFTNVGGFSEGTYTATLDLTLVDNALSDGSRDVTITLANPPLGVTLGTPAEHLLTINDDDTAATGIVAFDAVSSSVAEDGGSTNIGITLTVIDGPPNLNSPITLDVGYSGSGTADLNTPPGTITFSNVGGFGAGTYTTTLTLNIIDNAVDESDRTLSITLNNPPAGVVFDGLSGHTLSILDDDEPAGNTPPVATGDSYSVTIGSTLNVAAPGVLTNDNDVDSDPLTAALNTNVSKGTLSLNSDGSFTYTPNIGASGTDSFTYLANDGTMNSNIATVNISLLQPAGTPPRLYPADNQTLIGTTSPQWEGFRFQQMNGVEWYQIWIGYDNYTYIALYEWFAATDAAGAPYGIEGICEAGVCTIPQDVWLYNGNYEWWMTYWGPDTALQNYNSFWNATDFRVNFSTPSSTYNITTPTGTVNSADEIVWQRDLNVHWYQIWVGASNYSYTALYGWFDATDPTVCNTAGVCTLPLDFALLNGSHEWWMEAWGPGGYVSWLAGSNPHTFTVGGGTNNAPMIEPVTPARGD